MIRRIFNLRLDRGTRMYHKNVIDHYENPRNIGSLDPKSLKVHSLEGLRVVDASAMPYVPNANINAPTLMLAEKASDLILENTPLPPQTQVFYKSKHNE